MANAPKVAVNGNTSASNPTVQDDITLALLQNGGIARIQATFRQRLDEAGWSEYLRNYVTGLFRSGECSTYFEAMEKVKAQVKLQGRDEEEATTAGRLVIPMSAAESAVGAVTKELERVCEMKK